jgi:hypothetical protein
VVGLHAGPRHELGTGARPWHAADSTVSDEVRLADSDKAGHHGCPDWRSRKRYRTRLRRRLAGMFLRVFTCHAQLSSARVTTVTSSAPSPSSAS